MLGIFRAAAWTAALLSLAACGPMAATNVLSTQAIPTGSPELPAGAAPTGEQPVLAYHRELGWIRGTRPSLAGLTSPLVPRGGAPLTLVEACRTAIEAAAGPYGVQTVQAVSAGPARRLPAGGLEAPVEIRVLYRRTNLSEVRQAVVTCRSNAAGEIVSASEA